MPEHPSSLKFLSAVSASTGSISLYRTLPAAAENAQASTPSPPVRSAIALTPYPAASAALYRAVFSELHCSADSLDGYASPGHPYHEGTFFLNFFRTSIVLAARDMSIPGKLSLARISFAVSAFSFFSMNSEKLSMEKTISVTKLSNYCG